MKKKLDSALILGALVVEAWFGGTHRSKETREPMSCALFPQKLEGQVAWLSVVEESRSGQFIPLCSKVFLQLSET